MISKEEFIEKYLRELKLMELSERTKEAILSISYDSYKIGYIDGKMDVK